MLLMKIRKRQITEGKERQSQQKYQNAQRKRNLQILGDIGSRHYQTNGDERKNLESVSQENEKDPRNQAI